MTKSIWKKNLMLIVLVIILAVIPLYLCKDAEFGGADGEAMDAISEIDPSYQSWAEPLLEPKSGEIESLLFALQAAIGAGVVGFVLGRITKGGGEPKAQPEKK
ncbi:energy-coupling factor ABC transporter substrate-binding protein [Intestinibacillus massiliensis]|nr:energy-coupling factor ABC transporter substrate-binding protein [Intestinibacillus massiliensis]